MYTTLYLCLFSTLGLQLHSHTTAVHYSINRELICNLQLTMYEVKAQVSKYYLDLLLSRVVWRHFDKSLPRVAQSLTSPVSLVLTLCNLKEGFNFKKHVQNPVDVSVTCNKVNGVSV